MSFQKLKTASARKKSPENTSLAEDFKATLTGLEPATTGSTVRYSNQLSYSAVAVWREIIVSHASWQDVKTVSEFDF